MPLLKDGIQGREGKKPVILRVAQVYGSAWATKVSGPRRSGIDYGVAERLRLCVVLLTHWLRGVRRRSRRLPTGARWLEAGTFDFASGFDICCQPVPDVMS